MLACLLIVFLSVITCEGGSSKKGVCIPPGTNFHCGDLAAFNNTRKVNFGCVGKQVKVLIFITRTSGRSAPIVLVPGFDKSNIEECD